VLWTGFIWLGIETSGGLLWTRYFGSHKMFWNSWVAERLATSQEGLSSMELVIDRSPRALLSSGTEYRLHISSTCWNLFKYAVIYYHSVLSVMLPGHCPIYAFVLCSHSHLVVPCWGGGCMCSARMYSRVREVFSMETATQYHQILITKRRMLHSAYWPYINQNVFVHVTKPVMTQVNHAFLSSTNFVGPLRRPVEILFLNRDSRGLYKYRGARREHAG
jgi:hypothetical protein